MFGKVSQKLATGFTFMWVWLGYPAIVFADILGDRLATLESSSDDKSFATNFYEAAIPLGVISLVALCVYAGFLMITSQGDPEKLQEAKEMITNAVIGFILIVISVALLSILAFDLNLAPDANN